MNPRQVKFVAKQPNLQLPREGQVLQCFDYLDGEGDGEGEQLCESMKIISGEAGASVLEEREVEV